MQYEDFLAFVKSRRSIRQFKPDPLPDEFIEKMIEAARWAPSGFNCQLWEFIAVKNPELRDRIGDAISAALQKELGKKIVMGWRKAPVFILVFGDTRVRSHSPIPPLKTDDSKWMSMFYASLACAYQYAALAATSLELGSQWVTAVEIPEVEVKIKSILGIPGALKIFNMLAVGYPDMAPPPKAMRAREEILHFDACGEDAFRTDEQIREYFLK